MNAKTALGLALSMSCAVLIGMLGGCSAHHSVSVRYNLALPSGEHVVITDAHGDSFVDVKGVKRHIYYVMYETAHDMDNVAAMQKEALRVWAAYLPDVVGVDYDSAVVTPTKTTSGGGVEGRPNYLKRMPDGTWEVQ